jgi:hypothetical protein
MYSLLLLMAIWSMMAAIGAKIIIARPAIGFAGRPFLSLGVTQ